jgi:hypothetical protein
MCKKVKQSFVIIAQLLIFGGVCLGTACLVYHRLHFILGYLASVLVSFAFNKILFYRLICALSNSANKQTREDCGKRLADWFEKMSAAIFVVSFVNILFKSESLPLEYTHVLASVISIFTLFFCSMRFTAFIADGLFDDATPPNPKDGASPSNPKEC